MPRVQGVGLAGERYSPVPTGSLGSWLTAYITGARDLNLFLLARATASCERVEKYVSVCFFSLVIDTASLLKEGKK